VIQNKGQLAVYHFRSKSMYFFNKCKTS